MTKKEGKPVALPCVCYKCAVYKELKTIRDPLCLSMEEKNCEGRDCDRCDFVCEGYNEKESDRFGGLKHFANL